jgi:hypothetical protein
VTPIWFDAQGRRSSAARGGHAASMSVAALRTWCWRIATVASRLRDNNSMTT